MRDNTIFCITFIPNYYDDTTRRYRAGTWLRVWKHNWRWGGFWGHAEADVLWYGVHIGLYSIAILRG